ncbi:MAG: hypothetical protein ACNA7V_01760 [Bacteroidales bacterium]
MKKKFILQGSILLLIFLFVLVNGLFADAPPDPGGDPGGIGTPVGGGSPLGGGLFMLLAMGFFYGIKRIINHNRHEKIN